MDDLVKRLRHKHEFWALGSKGPSWVLEAADRIEADAKWIAENEKLIGSLEASICVAAGKLRDAEARIAELEAALLATNAKAMELMDACDKAGAFDNLVPSLFPDSVTRGTRKADGYARIDKARNEMRAQISINRAALGEKKGEQK